MGSHGTNGRKQTGRWLAAIRGLACALAALMLSTGALQAAPRMGDVLPKTTLGDLKGSPVAMPDEYKGKVVLIHFFATWCTYCPKEVAALESIYRKYRDRGVVPCSVDVGESKDKVASFREREGVSYPLLLDPASSAAKEYGVTGIPTTYIVDTSGVLRFRIIGEITEDGLERIVRVLLPSLRGSRP